MTFWNRKLVLTSTPTIKGASRIERGWETSDQRRFFVRCVKCEFSQVMRWEQVKWQKDETGKALPDTAAYHCEGCAAMWSEADRLGAVMAGEWRATAPFTGVAGFHLNALVSPWVRLPALAQEWLEAQKFPEKLRVFINTALGESWVNPEEQGRSLPWEAIRDRADDYELMEVPAGVLFLVCGVDTQDDRLAPVIYGYGRDQEAWLIYWGEIYGDPEYDDVWEQLTALRNRAFKHPLGADMHIACTAIDSGGHRTQAVYNYVRAAGSTVIAIKGQAKPNLPVIAGKPTPQDVTFHGKHDTAGVMLWPIGSDTAKAEIYARLRIPAPGPRYVHFPRGLPDEFYGQLTAERIVTRFHKGIPSQEWLLPSGKRNEVLDATSYAYAAAMHAGLLRTDWDALERAMAVAPSEKLVVQHRPVARSKYIHGRGR
jgi:phage terminase large subunit GpA-like protein